MTRRTITKSRAEPAVLPEDPRALPPWAQRILLPILFGAVAAACLLLGVLPVLDCARAMASGPTLVVAYPRDAVTFPLCLAFSLLAAMCALPDTQIRLRPSRRSTTARRADRIATVLFAGAGISMLMVPIATPVASVGLAWFASHHGYIACPSPVQNRHGGMRWVHEAHTCPKDP